MRCVLFLNRLQRSLSSSRYTRPSILYLDLSSTRRKWLLSSCIGLQRLEGRRPGRQTTWHGKLGEPTPVEQISTGITEGLARARICDLFASGIPSLHQPSPSPRPKRARPSIQRLHNIISDLIGLITISPVCAEHTLPLASQLKHQAALPPDCRNDPSPVSTQPDPFEKPLTSQLSTHHPQSSFQIFPN